MLDEVGAFQLADFARRCQIDRCLLKREAAGLARLAAEQAPLQALAGHDSEDERDLLTDETKPAPAEQLAEFARNAQQLTLGAEALINKAVQSCKRARANHLEAMAKMPAERRVLH